MRLSLPVVNSAIRPVARARRKAACTAARATSARGTSMRGGAQLPASTAEARVLASFHWCAKLFVVSCSDYVDALGTFPGLGEKKEQDAVDDNERFVEQHRGRARGAAGTGR